MRAGQDFPAQLERLLADDKNARIKVLNLGFNGEGAYSFTQTLGDYDYLDADLVVLYSGYNDLGPNYYNFRHRSPVFAWTGYLPLLPSLTVDKISAWRQQSNGENAKVVFPPPHLDELKTSPSQRIESMTCSPKWQFYCERIVGVTELALAKGKRVLIVGEPYLTDNHVEQQIELEKMLAYRFQGEPRVRYLNLGRVVDLRDTSLCWDGMHLTEEGNRRIAAALRQPALEMLR